MKMIVLALALALVAHSVAAQDDARAREQRAEARREIDLTTMMLRDRDESSALVQRLVETAQRAFEEARYADAVEYARRARTSMTRYGAVPERLQTPPSAPVIEILLEAFTRLYAAENRGMDPVVLAPIRELIETAEISLYQGEITRADQLSRRAIELLTRPGRAPSAVAASEPGVSRLDLNSATRRDLLGLPGVTEQMAENVLWFRKYIGPFLGVDELRFVPGFSREYVERNFSRLSVALQ